VVLNCDISINFLQHNLVVILELSMHTQNTITMPETYTIWSSISTPTMNAVQHKLVFKLNMVQT